MERKLKSIVYIFECNNYDVNNIYRFIKSAVEGLGGLKNLFPKGRKILLKPNFLAPETPDKATTTHPAIFEACGKLLRDNGYEVYYGDSPAFHTTESVAKKTGFEDIANKLNIRKADFQNSVKVFSDKLYQNKSFNIAKGVTEADHVVSLPKLKTHGLTLLTGAIKNQFGCIPGREKASYHVKLDDINRFSQMLVDLTTIINPSLYIMDAIIAMEGNGPHRGNPVHIGRLLISTDPVAIDSVAAKIAGINPKNIKTNVLGHKSGLGTMEEIVIAGNTGDNTVKVFKMPRKDIFISLPAWARKLIGEIVIPKPVFDYSKCIKCHECYDICPTEPKSIYIKENKFPGYKYSTCIKCYCCQETCPAGAINIKILPFRRYQ